MNMLQLDSESCIRRDPSQTSGCFFTYHAADPSCEKTVRLGTLAGLKHFTACYRFNACWMYPRVGNRVEEIPEETQFLIATDGSRYCLLFPLVDAQTRCSLSGSKDSLLIVAETGDDQTSVCDALVLYAIEGSDPFELVHTAAREIAERLGTCNLRIDKRVPRFTDLLGFCTYNAFGGDVTHDRILGVLETFQNHGLSLGYMIVDGGWQRPDGNYLVSFQADPSKFPSGIGATVREAKERFGLREIIVWHTYNGYWSGIKPGALPEYSIDMRPYRIPARIRNLMDRIDAAEDPAAATAGMNFFATNVIDEPAGFVEQDLFRFYFDFYAYLRKQGVDGAKIDAMAWIECFGEGHGGRVRMMQQLVSAVEGASLLHFNGEHINCSCCSNDFIYNTLRSGVTRTSIDYFPERPESHAMHVLTNVHTSLWMGEFILPDWDMFQSGNTGGEFHAISRAISGGPIYCTDEIGAQRFDILKRIATPDGRIGRCTAPARVTKDCLFVDPLKDPVPIKIFSHNRHGDVIGAFNCCHDPTVPVHVKGQASVEDVHGIKGERFHVHSFRHGSLGVFTRGETWDIDLDMLEADVFTLSPIRNGWAVIGMTEMYNPLGFVSDVSEENGVLTVALLMPGPLAIHLERAPRQVSAPHAFEGNLLVIDSNETLVQVHLK
jgi:raffinose synthase